jgi:hypothetical protein
VNMTTRLRIAQEGRERSRVVASYASANGRAWHVYADGSDDYCGEDDLTERAIENANDAWASLQADPNEDSYATHYETDCFCGERCVCAEYEVEALEAAEAAAEAEWDAHVNA